MVKQPNLFEIFLKAKEMSEWSKANGQYEFLAYLLEMVVIEAEFQYELNRRRAECAATESSYSIAA